MYLHVSCIWDAVNSCPGCVVWCQVVLGHILPLSVSLLIWNGDANPACPKALFWDLIRSMNVNAEQEGGRSKPLESWSITGSWCLLRGGWWSWWLSRSVVFGSCDPVGCSLPGSSVHDILQARILEWAVFSFFKDLPDPGIESSSPALQAGSLPVELRGIMEEEGERLQDWWTCRVSWTVETLSLSHKLMVAGGEGIVGEFEMDRYTLLKLKWIANHVLHGTLLSALWQPG